MKRWSFLMLTLLPLASWGQVYKCTDDNGRTTYSQTPCAADATELDVRTRSSGDYRPGLSGAEQLRLRRLQRDLEKSRTPPAGEADPAERRRQLRSLGEMTSGNGGNQ